MIALGSYTFAINCSSLDYYTNNFATAYDARLDRVAVAQAWREFMCRIFGEVKTPKQIAPTSSTTIKRKIWRIIFQPRWSCLRWKAKT